MKVFFGTLMLILVASAFASISIVRNSTDAAHPGKCVHNGVIMAPGESGQPKGKCIHYRCIGGSFDVNIITCNAYTYVSPPCEIGDYIDRNAAYPDCCKQKIVCPEGVKPTEIRMKG